MNKKQLKYLFDNAPLILNDVSLLPVKNVDKEINELILDLSKYESLILISKQTLLDEKSTLDYLGIKKQELKELLLTEKIKPIQTDTKNKIFEKSEIDRYIKDNKIKNDTENLIKEYEIKFKESYKLFIMYSEYIKLKNEQKNQ